MAKTHKAYRKPLWEKILIYLVIAGIIYALIYFYFVKPKYVARHVVKVPVVKSVMASPSAIIYPSK